MLTESYDHKNRKFRDISIICFVANESLKYRVYNTMFMISRFGTRILVHHFQFFSKTIENHRLLRRIHLEFMRRRGKH